jgi:pimeloyl-ACP methyl ester carboxylesterase
MQRNHLNLQPLAACLVLAGLWAAAAPGAAGSQAGPPEPDRTPVEAVTVRPHPCRIPGLDEEVKCATYAVWEDREGRKGRKIGLNIVILPALGPNPAPDPIFPFGGGPGQGIAEGAVWQAERKDIRQKRDIVLIDQRGTGRSNPLQCDFYGDPVDLRKAAGDSYPMEAVRACKEKLEKVADLRFYTTALSADDFNEVRAWLGYGKINLEGGSYGTRMAQVYLRRHPETVRSAVLTGVLPMDVYVPLTHAWAGQRALDIFLNECKADADCNAAFPDVRKELDAVLARVEKGVTVTLTDPETGEKVDVRPSRGLVAEGIRYLFYGQGGGSLPLQVHQAYRGDLAPLVRTAIQQRVGIHNILAMGMNFSVTCAEDLPFITEEMTRRQTAGTILGDYRVRQQKAVCEIWPRGEAPEDVHAPVVSDVPVLLISGERDSVTPPDFGERVARHLPNSLHVVIPRGHHGGAGECTEGLVRDFLDRASVEGLDPSCVKGYYPPPVFALVKEISYDPERVLAGTVYHYERSNADGTGREDASVFVEGGRVEVFRRPAGAWNGDLAVLDMDWANGSARRVEVWSVEGGRGRQLEAVFETLPGKALRGQLFFLGRPAETIAAPAPPWHFLSLDLTSLAVALPHLADPTRSFTFGVVRLDFTPNQTPFRYDGTVTATPAGNEDRGGVPAARFKLTGEGLGGREGTLWLARDGGRLQALEIPAAGEDQPGLKLHLKKMERMDPAGWEKFKTAQLGEGPPEGPVEAVTVRPHPCKFPGVDEEILCATYAVWEDREAKQGRKIGINMTILPAKGPTPEPDPVFFFGGGPGEGVAAYAPFLAGAPSWQEIRQKRDVVLIDQRGTGRSNTLDCTLYGDPVDFRKAAGDVFPLDAVRACKAELEQRADLRFYTTALAADDFNEIREWLGYGKINLQGGSYGTRMAQVYLRRHPETVRTATLIAVAPTNVYNPLTHAYAGKRAIDLLLAECRADAACNAAFPDVYKELEAVLARVEQGVLVPVTNTRTGEKVEVRPSRGLLAEGIRFLMYGPRGGSLPLQIHQAYQGDLSPIVQMAIERRLDLDEGLAMGLLFSVTCAEDLPYITEEMTRERTAGTFLGDYRIRHQKAVCEVWPRGAVPKDVHDLARSDVPVLLISGEWDPVTPPEFGDAVAKQLPNSLHVIVPKGSHGGAGKCTDDLIARFITTGTVQGLDPSCVKEYPGPKFMTGK